MKQIPWDRFGSKVGIGFCLVGFVLIFLGWNGAAGSNSVAAQFPYLISGGVAGLAMIVLGAALIVVETQRDDRNRLEAKLGELREAIERMGGPSPDGKAKEPTKHVAAAAGDVVCGEYNYHTDGCRLLEGREDLPHMSLGAARRAGLDQCRVCRPDDAPTSTETARTRR